MVRGAAENINESGINTDKLIQGRDVEKSEQKQKLQKNIHDLILQGAGPF